MSRNPFKGSYSVTFTSKSGKPMNIVTKAPSTTIGVYSYEDLNRRLDLAAKDPHITVDVKLER